MDKDFRFRLQKYYRGSKIACPQCGHRACFTRYIDTEGIITFPDYVGRCDREDKCGYHFTPKMYFAENPMEKERLAGHEDNPVSLLTRNNRVPMIDKKPSYIDAATMEQSMGHYDINPLHRYLCGVFGKDEADRLFKLYNVGTSNLFGGSTVFWQVDKENNKVRTGKIMRYDQNTGHRVKDGHPAVSWAHSALHFRYFRLEQCLFGEHLLDGNREAKVMVVESEKTTIVAAHFMPEFVWLATGGKNGCFNRRAMQVLEGRDVILMPDLGATAEWTEKSEWLRQICRSVTVSNVLERLATDEQRDQGLDIGEFLLMTEGKRMILDRMIRQSAALQTLIDRLGLVLVEDGGHDGIGLARTRENNGS